MDSDLYLDFLEQHEHQPTGPTWPGTVGQPPGNATNTRASGSQLSRIADRLLIRSRGESAQFVVQLFRDFWELKEQHSQLEQIFRLQTSELDKLRKRSSANVNLPAVGNSFIYTSREADHGNQHLVFCLLDGDGAIFEPCYIKRREKGGQDAAGHLVTQLQRYVIENCDTANFEIIVMLYYNKYGLRHGLNKFRNCAHDETDAFFRGFIQALPLINVVDVAAGKEEADTKLRHHFELFIKQPQTKMIFFGGDHDRGYANMLRAAQTMGLGDKIVVLHIHTKIEADISKLQLSTFPIPGLFLSEKMDNVIATPQFQMLSPSPAESSLLFDNSPLPAHTRAPYHRRQTSDSLSSQAFQSPGWKRRPCQYYVILGECENPSCTYDHEVSVMADEKEKIRLQALSIPCKTVNNGNACDKNGKCVFGHKCPDGPECEMYAKGKCKFRGDGMHS